MTSFRGIGLFDSGLNLRTDTLRVALERVRRHWDIMGGGASALGFSEVFE
jgi:hypothetical protein